MDPYSRLQGEFRAAHERVTTFQKEAASRRLLEQNRAITSWRRHLAAQLHSLADRLEPAPYNSAKGGLS